DERIVKKNLMRLVYLFEPYLAQVFAAERLSDVDAFEKQGRGAQLVAAFVLAGDPAGDSFVADNHAAERARFHEARQTKLAEMLLDPGCDVDCKGQGAELLLNGLEDYGPAYARVMVQLIEHLGPDTTQVVQRLHRRLLWCQTSRVVAARMLRDVLVPA